MSYKNFIIICYIFFFYCVGLHSKSSNSNSILIPITDLFSKPEKSQVHISPNGKMISYLAKHNGFINIWVQTIGEVAYPITKAKSDIKKYFWHHNNKCISYYCDKHNNGSCNLYSVNIWTKKEKNLTPFEGLSVGEILAYEKENPHEVVITTKKRAVNNYIDFDVCKVNIETGDIFLLNINDGNILNWFADKNNNVRAIKKLNADDGCYELLIKDNLQEYFKKIRTLEREDIPLCFSKKGNIFYAIDSHNANTKRLVAIDLVSGKSQVIYEDSKYDVNYAVFNPNTKKLEAAVVYKYRQEWIYFDRCFKKDMYKVQALDDGDVYLCSRNGNDTKWIIEFKKDNGPATFWLFDRKTKKGDFLFFDNSVLNKYTFVSVKPLCFTARDGLYIEGYITFPHGVARKNLPLVLLVHGGPWGRDMWGFDPEVQWLANRGYVVLQVNFRGSTGYGKSFLHAGDKQWGKKMQEDLLDAVAWAIEQEIADPAKICIYGFSYGGYAATMGAALTPNTFCCAVDICGPKNILDLVHEFARRFHHCKQFFYNRVGNPAIDQDLLLSVSPITHADIISIPLFIVGGAHDFRVKKEDTETIVSTLEKNNNIYKYFFFEDEGHWISKDTNKLKLYTTLEIFLEKHLDKKGVS